MEQAQYIKMRDKVKSLLQTSGAFRMSHVMGEAGSSYMDLACLDRMVEVGELVELPRNCWAQFKVYTTPEVENR